MITKDCICDDNNVAVESSRTLQAESAISIYAVKIINCDMTERTEIATVLSLYG